MVFFRFFILFCKLLLCLRAIDKRFLPCDVDINVTEVDCHDRAMDHVIYIRDTRVLTLNISFNRIRKVEYDTLSGVPNLVTLDMANNCKFCLHEMHIDYYAFKVLPNLEHLSLSYNGLRQIPWLPVGLRELHLDGNKIFRIENPFQTPLLVKLFLNFNCNYRNPCYHSYYIAENAFEQLTHLQTLDLAFNNLTTIPRGLPPSLTKLDLKENRLTEVADDAFVNLTKLDDLNVEWNCQRCDHAAQPCFPCLNDSSLILHPRSFYTVNSSITFLSLRGNSLRTFPEGMFKHLKRLRSLDVSDNKLSYAIQNGSFFKDLSSLTWLSLDYNFEPSKIFNRFNLSTHFSKMVNLQSLLFTGNFFLSLSNESWDTLSQFKKLETLELRMNFMYSCDLQRLKEFPSLKHIILSENMLSFQTCLSRGQLGGPSEAIRERRSIFPSRFQTPRDVPPANLERKARNSCAVESYGLSFQSREHCDGGLFLDLSQNDIMYLQTGIFTGLDNVVCLDLSLNYISQTLKEGAFAGLTNLRLLNMSHNRIDLFYAHAFSELNRTLKVLDLSHNEFYFNMWGMFHRFYFLEKLKKLEVLSLAHNNIGMRIDHKLNSSSLKTLYFNGNRLNYMWQNKVKYGLFFKNLTSLSHLDISANQLKYMTGDDLTNLPRSLRSLVISHNELVHFPWEKLKVMGNLTLLDLSHNSLDTIKEFKNNLKCLYLSSNQFYSFPESVLVRFKFLNVLHLDHNQLKELHFKLFPKPLYNKTNLKELTLHANPFKCDCDTSWFSLFLATTSIQIPQLTTLVQCSYPESQIGKSVLLIDQHSCQEIYGGIAFFISFCIVCIFTALPLLKHLYGWDLWYCLQVLWAGQRGYSQLSGSNYQYHAFVVFDTSNPAVRDWVYNELVVQMEDKNRRFNLCLEERDWVPGLSCIENLHNGVYNSVKTVFVLSSRKAMNGVIRQAFYMVQQRLLDEKTDVAVLVLLEKMYPKLKYLQLRKRLCGKSVLTWPKNPLARPLFWNQMRMAISSDNLKLYDRNMSESFIM